MQEIALNTRIGKLANQYASQSVLADHVRRKSRSTQNAYRSDLYAFKLYLDYLTMQIDGDLMYEGKAWRDITWGIVQGFVNWQITNGLALSTINRRLGTVRFFASLAFRSGHLDVAESQNIRSLIGFSAREAREIENERNTPRVGKKKPRHNTLDAALVQRLKQQPDTPKGRRDKLLVCFFFDHGFRLGEVRGLRTEGIDFTRGTITFFRPKVGIEQTHRLSMDTLETLLLCTKHGELINPGFLLRKATKSKAGSLLEDGVSTTSIARQIRRLGDAAGVLNLSPHDGRHYWCTHWQGRVDPMRLQEAGGWSSLEMPRRYTERAAIANEGMV